MNTCQQVNEKCKRTFNNIPELQFDKSTNKLRKIIELGKSGLCNNLIIYDIFFEDENDRLNRTWVDITSKDIWASKQSDDAQIKYLANSLHVDKDDKYFTGEDKTNIYVYIPDTDMFEDGSTCDTFIVLEKLC